MNQDKEKTISGLIDCCWTQMEDIRNLWHKSTPGNNKIYLKVLIDDLVKLSRITEAEQKILEEEK
jgi:hypothetical protein